MAKSNTAERNRWLSITRVITLVLISLVQLGCDSDSSASLVPASPTTPPALPAALTAVFPVQDSDTALVSTLVNAIFSDDMNETTITTSTFTLTSGGAPVAVASVSYDAATRTATLTPAADLDSATEYRATISTSVETISGTNPLTSDFIWSFTISPAITLVSKNADAVVGNDVSSSSAIDSSGRFIVFESEATNLAGASTTLNRNHIYRKDSITGEVVLVSSDVNGLEGNNSSFSPRVSDDGRFIVFESLATNLSLITTGGTLQVYIKDMADDSVDLVSRDVSGLTVANNVAENPDVSNDGRFVVFESNATNLSALNTNGATQIYLKDMDDESIDMLSRDTSQTAGGTGPSNRPYISPNAQFIVFDSTAGSSIVPGATNIRSVYFIDLLVPNTTELVSIDSFGVQGNGSSVNASVSNDGNFIAFESGATNLIAGGTVLSDIYRRDRSGGQTLLVSTPDGTTSGNDASVGASINSDGTYVAFTSSATNLVSETLFGLTDIFVRDFSTSPTVTINKINLTQAGAEATDNSANASISSDGRYVSFGSAFNYDVTDTNTINDIYRAHNSTF